jgi:hypothetical protein
LNITAPVAVGRLLLSQKPSGNPPATLSLPVQAAPPPPRTIVPEPASEGVDPELEPEPEPELVPEPELEELEPELVPDAVPELLPDPVPELVPEAAPELEPESSPADPSSVNPIWPLPELHAIDAVMAKATETAANVLDIR